jgi:LuxR family maltose regulon positive regulatory protein
MEAPLLATKLYAPLPRPSLVSRPRLTERLDEGLRLGRKLTLVSAPAGFGKTTLVSAWVRAVRESPLRVAWLSLDEGDNDPARFLAYLAATLQTVGVQVEEKPAVTEAFLVGHLSRLSPFLVKRV